MQVYKARRVCCASGLLSVAMSAPPEAAVGAGGASAVLDRIKADLAELFRDDESLNLRYLCESFIKDQIYPRTWIGDRVDAKFALQGAEFEEEKVEKGKQVVVKRGDDWVIGEFLLTDHDAKDDYEELQIFVMVAEKPGLSKRAYEMVYFKSASDVRLCDFPHVLPEHIRLIKRIMLWAHKSNNVFADMLGVDVCERICLQMVDYAHKWRLEW